MEDYVVRVKAELDQLADKREKLESFLDKQKVNKTIEESQLVLLNLQNTAMKLYQDILDLRLKNEANIEADMLHIEENRKEYNEKVAFLRKPDDFRKFIAYHKKYNQELTVGDLRAFGMSNNDIRFLERGEVIKLLLPDEIKNKDVLYLPPVIKCLINDEKIKDLI